MKRKKKKSLTKWKEELDRERRSVQSRSKTYWENKTKKMTQILIIQRSLKEIAINLPFDFLYANALLDHNERKAILKQKPIT